jgi:hypothetical protein
MLPYDKFATVTGTSNEHLGVIRLAVWETPDPRETPTGEVWNWSGEAEIEAAGLLVDQGNRRLYIVESREELEGAVDGERPPGRRLGLLAAVRHAFLPHLELRLAEMKGS